MQHRTDQSGVVLRGEGGHGPPSQRFGPIVPQMIFLVSVTGHLELKFSDYVLILCQKLHICTYDRQNVSGNWPLSETPGPHALSSQNRGARTAPVASP